MSVLGSDQLVRVDGALVLVGKYCVAKHLIIDGRAYLLGRIHVVDDEACVDDILAVRSRRLYTLAGAYHVAFI